MFDRSLMVTPIPREGFGEEVKEEAREVKNEQSRKTRKKVSDAKVSGKADAPVKRKRKTVGKVGK